MSEEKIEELRDEKGRIKPGFTLNPGGRPRKKQFRDYFTEEEEEDLILRIKQEIKGEPKGDIVKMVVEQIFGKPKQPLVGGDPEDPAIKVKHEIDTEEFKEVVKLYGANAGKENSSS